MRGELFCLFIRNGLPVLRTVSLHLLNDLHCFFIFFMPELHFFRSGVMFLSQRSSKSYSLPELEVPFILYGLNRDVGRSTSLLRKVSILRSVQELAMAGTGDHISLKCSITNTSVENTSWSNGYMNLFHLKNFYEGLGSEDVDLNMPDGFRAFIGHLSAKVLWFLLVA
jgi:hypothetical protein